MKKVKSSQAAILPLNRVKQFFPVSIANSYDLQMSILKHFSVDSIKFEFGNKEKVEF